MPAYRSSVGIVIDGVYRPRNSVGFTDLGELERIEVLKGPQGTVFGKNTSAGVINVVTRRPSYTQSAEGEVTVGNYGALGLAGAYNDALGEHSAMRIYAALRTRDGVDDVRTGGGPRTETDDGDQNMQTLRGQLLWEPAESVQVNFAADYTSREENCCVTVTTVRGPTAAILNALTPGGEAVIPVADPDRRLAYSNRSTEQDIKDKGFQAQVDWTTPWANEAVLTSITAWRDWQAINGLDFDYSAADVLYRAPDEDESLTAFETFKEFRLTGSSETIDWMVGLFYSDEDLDRNETYRYGRAYEPYLSTALIGQINPALALRPDAPLFLSQATGRPFGTLFPGLSHARHLQAERGKHGALHQQHLARHRRVRRDLGLRYTREKKTLESDYTNPNGSLACASYFLPNGQVNPAALQRIGAALVSRGVPAAAVPTIAPQVIGFTCLPWANVAHNGRSTDQERDEKEWSGTLKLAYNFSQDVMAYASYARGYKAGGFNLDRVQSSNGLSSGTGGIIPVNDTSFPGEFVDSYELGTKTTWADGNLLLNAALFYQEYTDFQLNSFMGTSFVVRSIPEVTSKGVDAELLWNTGIDGLSMQAGVVYADTQYGDDLLPDAGMVLLPGSQMSFAPKWSTNANLTYEWDIGGSLGPLQHRRQVHVRVQHRLDGPTEAAGRLHPAQCAHRHRRPEPALVARAVGPEPRRRDLQAGRYRRADPDRLVERLPRRAASVRHDPARALLTASTDRGTRAASAALVVWGISVCGLAGAPVADAPGGECPRRRPLASASSFISPQGHPQPAFLRGYDRRSPCCMDARLLGIALPWPVPTMSGTVVGKS